MRSLIYSTQNPLLVLPLSRQESQNVPDEWGSDIAAASGSDRDNTDPVIYNVTWTINKMVPNTYAFKSPQKSTYVISLDV